MKRRTLLSLFALLIAAGPVFAQPTAFTYQGRLNSSGGAATGLYDFSFNLYAASSGGLALTSSNGVVAVPVSNGLFTVTLNFGNQFTGADRWLEIAVRTNGPGGYATLSNRQFLASVPYAIRAGSAGTAATATTATTANGVAAGAVTLAGLASGAVDSSKIADGTIVASDLSFAVLSNTFWRLTGNAGTTPTVNFLGTTDGQALRIQAPRVGINTTNPAGTLDVNTGAGSAIFRSEGAAPVLVVSNSPNEGVLRFRHRFEIWPNPAATEFGTLDVRETNGAVTVRLPARGPGYFLNGPIGIGTSSPENALLDVEGTMRLNNFDLMLGAFAENGSGLGTRQSYAGQFINGVALYGHAGGLLGTTFDINNANSPNYGLRWDNLGNVFVNRNLTLGQNLGVGTTSPQQKLHVAGRFLRVDGDGNEQAYLGGDGVGGEVQVGSLNPAINNVLLWNAGNNTTMDLIADQITANQFNGPLNGTLSGTFSGGVSASSLRLGTSSSAGSVLAATDAAGNIGFIDLIHQPVSRGSLLNLVGSVNFRSGASVNSIGGGVIGATLLGGGRTQLAFGPGTPVSWPNSVSGDYATVAGGASNSASGAFSFVAGGFANGAAGSYSFAAGRNAKANHQSSFVWADSQSAAFGSSTIDEFSIRAAGGLRLDASTSINFDQRRRQMLNLWGTEYGIGIQDFTFYSRTDGDFAWYRGGAHADGLGDTGGGTEQMRLHSSGRLTVGGDFIVAKGTGNEQGYIGGDGAGNNVQVGSLNSGIMTVELFNTVNGLMDLQARDASVRALTIRGGADLAEPFHMSDADVPKGSLVIIDEENPGKLKLAEGAYDTRVAGIISGANGVNAGITLHQEGLIEGGQNVALSGRVYALADAGNGPIKPGDLLTSSNTPGHVMRVTDHARAQGAIVGKAMSALKEGKGFVLVLVSLQ